MAKPSRKILVASALGLVSLAFAGGFVASSATASPVARDPIVNANAWNEKAPAMPAQIVSTQRTETCNPWDVSDVAMEEILVEMQRRGWRPPRQGEAMEALASFGVEGISAADPDAPMPGSWGYSSRRDTNGSFVTVANDSASAPTANTPTIESVPSGEAFMPAPS